MIATFLPVDGAHAGTGTFIRWCVIYNITLHTTDIDGVINNISAATRLTWMLTDQGTCRRERIVFTDQANWHPHSVPHLPVQYIPEYPHAPDKV